MPQRTEQVKVELSKNRAAVRAAEKEKHERVMAEVKQKRADADALALQVCEPCMAMMPCGIVVTVFVHACGCVIIVRLHCCGLAQQGIPASKIVVCMTRRWSCCCMLPCDTSSNTKMCASAACPKQGEAGRHAAS